ncbi:hypothetical protein HDU98_001290, partial [Podochytrium sp. JEL0797]
MDSTFLRMLLSSNVTLSSFALTRRQKAASGSVLALGIALGFYHSLADPEPKASSALHSPFAVSPLPTDTNPFRSMSHHLPDAKGFANPWPSYRKNEKTFLVSFAKLLLFGDKMPPIPPVQARVPTRPIDWDRIAASYNSSTNHEHELSLTWLSHAAFLLTMPGARILLDPCLSDRCSPLSFAGPRRIVAPPCKVDELNVDCVVISHNHYDHLDLNVLKKLMQVNRDVLFFVPLGNKRLLMDEGITNVVECDWWDSYRLHKPKTASAPESNLQISCTPSQHFSGRTLWDHGQTLWSSWHIQSTVSHAPSPHNNNSSDARVREPTTTTKSFFFGGDTGYRTVFPHDCESLVPTCPAFRQIHTRFGPPDLAALPIGAYAPRELLSNVHCSPADAVDVHVDLGAKKSVACHWGTFVLSREDVMDPPRVLRRELEARGMGGEEFMVVDVGETVTV